MTDFADRKKKLALRLFDVGVIQFGQFKFKIHELQPETPLSPICFNLRYNAHSKGGPLTWDIISEISGLLFEFACQIGLKYDRTVGIPGTGKLIAEAFSLAPKFAHRISLLNLLGKTVESKRLIIVIDGRWAPGDVALLLDDVITDANSKLEAISVLESYGLKVRDVLVVVDREQGGREALEEKGYNFYSLFRASELIDICLAGGKITKEKAKELKEYFILNQVKS